MEQKSPPSPIKIAPDSSETTPITPSFPNLPEPDLMSDIEVARFQVAKARIIASSLIDKLSTIQQQLSSDLGFEEEEDNLMATRQWADHILDVAWALVIKSGKLVEDVDHLMPRLLEEKDKEWKGDEKIELPSGQNEVIQTEENTGDRVEK